MISRFYVTFYKVWQKMKLYVLTEGNLKKIVIGLIGIFIGLMLLYGGNVAYKGYKNSLVVQERDLEVDKYNEEMKKYDSRERLVVGDKVNFKDWQERISKVPSDSSVLDAGMKIITVHDEESRELASISLKWVNYLAQGDIGSTKKNYGFFSSAKSATLLYSGKTFTSPYQEYIMVYKTLGVSGGGKIEQKIERLHLVYLGDSIARWYVD